MHTCIYTANTGAQCQLHHHDSAMQDDCIILLTLVNQLKPLPITLQWTHHLIIRLAVHELLLPCN